MSSEKKEYSRSVRMTNTVKEFVENQEGEGFNEKFENMVLFCMDKLPEIEKQIAQKQKLLKELSTKVSKQENILKDIDSMRWSIESVINRAKAIAGKETE